MLSEKDLQRYKRDLERARRQVVRRAESVGSSVNPADERDTEDADIIVHIQTREHELWAKDELQKRLYEIDHALKRIAEGTYGLCEVCGAEIEPERLTILPETTGRVRRRAQADRRALMAAHKAEEEEAEEEFAYEAEEEEEEEEEEEVEEAGEEEEEGLEEVEEEAEFFADDEEDEEA